MNTPTPTADERRTVPRNRIFPWPMQPRKNFDLEYLNQLAASITQHGVLNDLICRHRAGQPGEFEIIGGECRWRASELAALEELPIKIREMSDGDALELALVDNMKRKDLTELEECDAFWNAMEQRDEHGQPRYATFAALAAKIDVSADYVEARIKLRKLPKAGRDALAAKRISFTTARVICKVPAASIEKVLEVVLHPSKHDFWDKSPGDVLDAEEAQGMIHDRFVRTLSGAPFQLNDAKLMPEHTNEGGERIEGGPCSDCPWNSANQQKTEEPRKGRFRGDRGSEKFCLNPACFTKKVERHVAAELVKAKEKGATVLAESETKKIMYDNGALKHSAAYVELTEKPGWEDKNPKVEDKKVPTWKKIVEGEVSVPVVVAVDGKGHVHHLVERKHAIAAAQKNGTAHFLSLSTGGGRSLQGNDYADRQRREREEQKRKAAVAFAVMDELVKAAALREPADLWPWMIGIAEWHGSSDACQFVMKRRELTGKDHYEAVRKYAQTLGDVGAQRAFALELLCARLVKFSGIGDKHFSGLCKLYDVDAAAIDKAVRADMKEKKKAKAKKVKPEKKEKAAPKKTKARGITPEARQKVIDALKARWAKSGRKVEKTKDPEPQKPAFAEAIARARELIMSGKAGNVPQLQALMETDNDFACDLWDAIADEKAASAKQDEHRASVTVIGAAPGKMAKKDDLDTLIEKARELKESEVAFTVPMLQGKLKIGYQKALQVFEAIMQPDAEAAEVTI